MIIDGRKKDLYGLRNIYAPLKKKGYCVDYLKSNDLSHNEFSKYDLVVLSSSNIMPDGLNNTPIIFEGLSQTEFGSYDFTSVGDYDLSKKSFLVVNGSLNFSFNQDSSPLLIYGDYSIATFDNLFPAVSVNDVETAAVVSFDSSLLDVNGSEYIFSTLSDILIQNSAPSIEVIGNKNFREGELINLTIKIFDEENDEFTFDVNDSRFDLVNNRLVWLTNFSDGGNYSITISATDSLGQISSYSFNLIVLNVNRAPVISGDEFVSAKSGESITINYVVFDPDNDSLQITINDDRFQNQNNSFVWSSAKQGEFMTAITVTDSELTATLVTNVSVLNTNVAPNVTINHTKKLFQGQIAEFELLVYDADNDSIEIDFNHELLDFVGKTQLTNGWVKYVYSGIFDTKGRVDLLFDVKDGSFEIPLSAYVDVVSIDKFPKILITNLYALDEFNYSLNTDLNCLVGDIKQLSFNNNVISWRPKLSDIGVHPINISCLGLTRTTKFNVSLNPSLLFDKNITSAVGLSKLYIPVRPGKSLIDVSFMVNIFENAGFLVNDSVSANFTLTKGKRTIYLALPKKTIEDLSFIVSRVPEFIDNILFVGDINLSKGKQVIIIPVKKSVVSDISFIVGLFQNLFSQAQWVENSNNGVVLGSVEETNKNSDELNNNVNLDNEMVILQKFNELAQNGNTSLKVESPNVSFELPISNDSLSSKEPVIENISDISIDYEESMGNESSKEVGDSIILTVNSTIESNEVH